MAQNDLANNVTSTQLIVPGNLTATNNTDALDTQFMNGSMLVLNMGNSSDTLSGSVYWTLILQDSPDDSAWTAVTSNTSVTYGTVNTSTGVYATIDDPAEDSTLFKIGYVGPQRYVRVAITATGSMSSGTIMAVTGYTSPIHKPSSGGDDGSPTG